jgi:hypothetical protein
VVLLCGGLQFCGSGFFVEWNKMRLNQVKTVAFLVSVLISGQAIAVSEYATPAAFSADLSKVGALIKPTLSKKPLKPGASKADAEAEALREQIAELDKVIKGTKEEKELAEVNKNKLAALDRLKALTAQPKAIVAAELDKEKKKNEALEAGFAQAASQPSNAANPSDLDMSGIDTSCNKGVDLAGFQSLASQMKNEPFSYLVKNGTAMLVEKAKELKEKAFENFFALLKANKENAAKKRAESPEQNEFQKQIAELAKFSPGSGFGDEQRLANLKAEGKKLDQGIATWDEKLSEETEKMVKSLQSANGDKAKVQAIAGPFADNLEQFRVAAVQSAKTQADTLYKNCRAIAEKVGRDNPNAQNTLIGTAYNMLVAMYNGDSTQYADSFKQALSSEARVMQCKKASPQIEAQLGASMQAKIKQVASATNPETLLQGALSTMTALGNANAEVGRAFVPAKTSCNELAKFSKKIEDFTGNVQSQVAAQGQAQQPGLANTQRRGAVAPGANNALAVNPAHNAVRNNGRI